ncbi:MAG: hypothetical protein CMJ48_13095, partial [Planctomycetaceae bacterium]|nr:hypothetical protein [Planctomycetaceae bacterium]
MESIFLAALDKATPEERAAYLNEACGDGTELRRRVEALLKADNDAGSFLQKPPVEIDPGRTAPYADNQQVDPQHSVDDPTIVEVTSSDDVKLDFLSPSEEPDCLGRLGSYEITAVVGRGGMGVVLKGRDPELNRVVAIKVLAPELALNAMARRRFLREAQAAAAVSHDHVVTIHAINQTDRLPHLAMEFVNGQSLQQRLDRSGPLELKEILRIGKQAAAGLAAAHAEGLIHRDIKPANILLENGVERVKITDFGLARAVDDVSLTQTGVVAGTPQYMSPEQAQGERVDHRTDLFSLGSVLYAMCTGRPPFRADSTIAVIRRVCDDTPRPIQQVNPDIPGWLAAIIDKLLAKDPDQRFGSATEVAELLGQHLAHIQQPSEVPQPVPVLQTVDRSRPGHATRRSTAKRWVAAAILLLALFGSLGFTEATGRTQITATVIRVVTGEGTLIVEVADPTVKVSIDGDEVILSGAGVRELRVRPGVHNVQVTKGGREGKRELVRVIRDGQVAVIVSQEGIETLTQKDYFPRLSPFEEIRWNGLNPEVRVRGKWFQLLAINGIPAENIVRTCIERHQSKWQKHFGEDIVQVLSDMGHRPRHSVHLELRDLANGSTGKLDVRMTTQNRRAIREANQAQSTVAVPRNAAFGDDVDLVVQPNVPLKLTEVRRLKGHQERVYFAGHSVDGRYVYSVSRDQTLRLWDTATGRKLKQFHTRAPLRSADMSRDGRILVAGGHNGTMTVWNVESGDVIRELRDHKGGVYAVALSDDAKQLVAATTSGSVKLWDLATGRMVWEARGSGQSSYAVGFSPDGRQVMVCTQTAIRILDRKNGNVVSQLRSGGKGRVGGFRNAAYSPDGRWVAVGCWEDVAADIPSRVGIWDGKTDHPMRWLGAHEGGVVTGISFSPDGRYLWSGGVDRTLRLWDIESGQQLAAVEADTQCTQFVSSLPDGKSVVTAGGERWDAAQDDWVGDGDYALRLWQLPQSVSPKDKRDETELTEVRRFEGHTRMIYSVAVSPDGRFLLSAARGGAVLLSNLETGKAE